MSDPRTREQRLRRAAARQRLQLVKSRRRDPRAFDFEKYMLISPDTTAIVAGELAGHPAWTLDDVEAYLNGERS
jgi:hypothetical protein